MSDDELRRLLDDLAGEPPANPMRSQAVHARIAREGRRRAAVRATTAAAAVVLVAVGGAGLSATLDRTPSAPDQLGAAPGSTTAPAATPGPTGTPGGPSPSPTTGPATGPGATRSPAPPALELRPSSLLSTSFVEESFAQGRTSLVQNYDDGEQQLGGCAEAAAADLRRSTGRSWSWPDEVVVSETLLELASDRAADAFLRDCARVDPASQPLAEPLRVGDDAVLVQERWPLYRQLHAAARVGRVVVHVQWRQSGPVSSAAPVVRALRAAVAKAVGDPALDPVAAEPQRPDPRLAGYLTRAGFPDDVPGVTDGGSPYEWLRDKAGDELRCGDAALPSAADPVLRVWQGPSVVSLAVAQAAPQADATQDFAACRAAQRGTPDEVAGLGDEAYYVADGDEAAVLVRSGSTYLVVRSTGMERSALELVARAALTAWQEAQP